MRKKILATCFMCIFLISACTPNDDQDALNDQDTQNNKDQNTDMIHYESKKEQENRLNNNEQVEYGTPEEKQRFNSGNENEEYKDLFTTPESKKISDKLLRYPDVKQAQVAIKDDEVVVAIMLSTGYSNDIRHTVKSDVENMTDKKVIVYTDARYLNNMDDMNAKRNPSDVDEYIKEYLDNFFHK